ncbi:hypothetical protein LOD99_3187 [Oopsacas minuta]|uniref:Fibronectin type-III domain-containing protein n=1 Tax=Oopsacas minuta TaxID=111878 RepID=A0AAV7JXI3_9METZ|nr:hypothetical protein LOD99_3187 [Oopsacas minuta]
MAPITPSIFYLITLLSINIFYSYAPSALNTFTFNPPEPLCVGEQVVMKCSIDLSPSSLYRDISSALISINGTTPISIERFGELATMDVDISRYSAEFVTNNQGQDDISALITIAGYLPIDSSIVFGCHGLYINSSYTPALAFGSPTTALIPTPPSLTDTGLSINPSTCETVVTTYLIPPDSSDRAIESYSLYLNMVLVLTVAVDSNFNDEQEINTKLKLNREHVLSVVAMSCVGKSPTYTQVIVELPSYLFKPDSLDFTINSENQLFISWELSADDKYEIIMSYEMELKLKNIPVGHLIAPSHEIAIKSEFSQTSKQNSYTVDLSLLNSIDFPLNISVTLQIISRCEYNATGKNKIIKVIQYNLQLNNTDSVLSEESQSIPVYGTVVIAILAIALVGCFMVNILITFLVIKSCKPNSKAENPQIMKMDEEVSIRKNSNKHTIEEANQLYTSPRDNNDSNNNLLSDSNYSTIN